MARLITIRQRNGATPAPVPLVDFAPISLAANVISQTEIDLVATYPGPPTKSTFTFQWAKSPGGPWTTLAVQSGATIAHTSLTQNTTYCYRVNVQSTETPSRTSAWSAIQSATTQSTVSPGFYYMDLAWGTSDPLNPLRFSNRGFSGTNGWTDILGVDSITGQVMPPEQAKGALWGGVAPLPTAIQCIGVNPLTDQERAIVSATLHDGSVGNVYRNRMVAPYTGQPVGGTQNDLILWPDTSNGVQGMAYVRKWVPLPSDFHTRMQNASVINNGTRSGASSSAFFVLSTCKTGTSSARIILWISRTNSSGFADPTKSYFQIDIDGFVGNTSYKLYKTWAIGPSPTNPTGNFNAGGLVAGPAVPVGTTFMIEHAYRQTSDSTGWIWFALNGTEVFLYQGITQDPTFAGEKINRVFPHSAYSNLDRDSSPFDYSVERLQVATAFPPDATPRSQPLS